MAERLYVVDANSNGIVGVGAREMSQEQYNLLKEGVEHGSGSIGRLKFVPTNTRSQKRFGSVLLSGESYWSCLGDVLIGKIGRGKPSDVDAVQLVTASERGLNNLAKILGLQD